MQAPQYFEEGAEVVLHYQNGYKTNPRHIVEWTGVGIVTRSIYSDDDGIKLTFVPFHRIDRITLKKIDEGDYPSPYRDRGVAATAGVG